MNIIIWLIIITVLLILNFLMNYRWRKKQSELNAVIVENLKVQRDLNSAITENLKVKTQFNEIFSKFIKTKK